MVTIHNPIVRGTQPDPSVVRVGGDFYLATSSFDLLPGVQIRHSRDLLNWSLIGAAVRRPEQYRRDGKPGAISLFAPTLRHHDGVFYVACTNVADDQGNFIVRTSDPAGEWSDAMWIDRGAFDPSLLFDEGRCYYTRRTLDRRPDGRLGPIVQAELDLTSGRLGAFSELSPDSQGFCSNDIEGPHLYRIGNWYYLFSAEGGSWAGHMQTCARSRSPWGPFEPAPHNPVLTHRHRVAHPIQTLGHADLVDDQDGRWWAVALGTRHTARGGFVQHHNLGRETFLAPVEWVDEWPVVGDAGTIELTMQLDRSLPGPPTPASDGPRSDAAWAAGWRSVGVYSKLLEETSAGAVSVPAGQGLEQEEAGRPLGALLHAQTEDEETVSVSVQQPQAATLGVGVGVGVYSDSTHFYCLLLQCEEDGCYLIFERHVDDLVDRRRIPVPSAGSYEFQIDATAERYVFSATPAGGTRLEAGSGSARLLSAESAEWFVGVHFALLNLDAAGEASPARFFNYRQHAVQQAAPTNWSAIAATSTAQ